VATDLVCGMIVDEDEEPANYEYKDKLNNHCPNDLSVILRLRRGTLSVIGKTQIVRLEP
jgi:hypothetical protein